MLMNIYFIFISQQDLENFKAEVEKRSEALDSVKTPIEQQECTS